MAYGQMDITVQEAVQSLITALIRSLGPNHGKLLTLMRTCPPGAESLALRVLTIFTEHGRASAQLVALVKGLVSERDLDARFLIPIIAEMDKVRENDQPGRSISNNLYLAGYCAIPAPHCLIAQRLHREQEFGPPSLQLCNIGDPTGIRHGINQSAAGQTK